MKKLLALILTVSVLSALAACGGGGDSDLVGSWESKDTPELGGGSIFLEFSRDGTGRETSYMQGGRIISSGPFTWEAEDGYLILLFSSSSMSFTYEVDGDALILSFTGWGWDIWDAHPDGVYIFQRA